MTGTKTKAGQPKYTLQHSDQNQTKWVRANRNQWDQWLNCYVRRSGWIQSKLFVLPATIILLLNWITLWGKQRTLTSGTPNNSSTEWDWKWDHQELEAVANTSKVLCRTAAAALCWGSAANITVARRPQRVRRCCWRPRCSLGHLLMSTMRTASHPCTYQQSDDERSWRSWRPSTPSDPAAQRSLPESPCSDALSPWIWRPTYAAGSPWRPCAASWQWPWPGREPAGRSRRSGDDVAEVRWAVECSAQCRLDYACTLPQHTSHSQFAFVIVTRQYCTIFLMRRRLSHITHRTAICPYVTRTQLTTK